MRFIANGPDIPEELLVARDKGDVIFFCGAGVSQANARLPNFERLGREVIRILGAALDSPARLLLDKALEMGRMAGVGGLLATDRVFGLLEREFEVRDVREAVAEAIRPPDGYRLDAHRILLDLATSRAGITRLVTTNFDLLFEECDPNLPRWGPPRLPDPRSDREFRGIVHLHGRVDGDYTQPADDEFVVSSADFGRAYLSDGWATRFIQSLLNRYQIVFVGHSADDPPMQYLLEALNLHAGTRARLFAFQEGDAGEATALWEHRGVRAIPFDGSKGFGPLWDTLGAWAERARDVERWYTRLIERAASGPASTDPHFRGMVAKVMTTREGAHRIATSLPTLDARWLLAIDPAQRYAPPDHIEPYDDTTEIFNPFDALALDCDVAPSPSKPDDFPQTRSPPEGSLDPLAKVFLDEDDRAEFETAVLRGGASALVAPMPPRLSSLGIWIRQIAHDPLTLWWAARQDSLHPYIQQEIQASLRRSPNLFSEPIRRGWQLLFMAWADRRDNPDMVRYDLAARAERDGWSLSLIRDVAAIYRPWVKIEPAFGVPHPLHWKTPVPDNLMRVDVEYPHPHEPLPIPDALVPYAVTQFLGNLELAIALEREITGDDRLFFETTRSNDGGPALTEREYGLTGPIVVLQNLMARLSQLDRETARSEVARWPVKDEYIFARLRIWAASRRNLLDGSEAAAIFLRFPDRVFWGSQHKRDLLYALRDRWPDLSDANRSAIEQRLRTGSYPWSDDVHGGPVHAAALDRLNRIYWLSIHGVVFAFNLEAEMASLQAVAPEWNQTAGAEAAESNAPRVFSIDTDDSADVLLEVPIADILVKAHEHGRIDIRDHVQREPFQGLVQRRPVRAFLALVHAARQGEVPREPWADFLYSEARKADRPRMICAIVERLCALPIERFHNIAYPVSQWMEQNAQRFFDDVPGALDPLWERMIESLMLENANPPHRPGRSWADEALNAPVGKLIGLLMKDPAKNGLGLGAGYPRSWRDRLDQLLGLPGNLRRQALVMISFHITSLFLIDPVWVETSLLPAADEVEDGDAFWDGFLWAARMPSHELFLRLKSGLVMRALRPPIRRNHGDTLAAILLAGWGGDGNAQEPERLLADVEFREVLIHADNEFRRDVIGNLERWSVNNQGRWRTRVLTFLRDVWPKQRALRTPDIAGKLAEFALASGDLMPDVVATILPRLTAVRGGIFPAFALHSENSDFPARRYPKAMLDLLEAILPEDPRQWPYKIETVLEILEQSPETGGDPRLSALRRRRQY